MFKNSFSDWPERKQTGTFSRGRVGELDRLPLQTDAFSFAHFLVLCVRVCVCVFMFIAAASAAPKFDTKTMHMKAEAEKPRMPDDGTGKIEVSLSIKAMVIFFRARLHTTTAPFLCGKQ